jgi:hypothetical protein
MRALVELGADVHAMTIGGNTALHVTSNAETVVCLLEAGAQLNIAATLWGRRRSSERSTEGLTGGDGAGAGGSVPVCQRLYLVDEACLWMQ